MKSIAVKMSLVAALLCAVALVGALPTFSDNNRARLRQQSEAGAAASKRLARRASEPLTYRSPGATHKLVIDSADSALEDQLVSSRAARRVRRYGSYTLIEVTDSALSTLDASALERATLRDDLNLILLKRGQIDTTAPAPDISADLRQSARMAGSLHMVQLFGPPTPNAIEAIKRTGARVISYIPNNAYLLWATSSELERVRSLRKQAEMVQWDGPFHPAYKLDPHIRLESVEQIATSITLLDTPDRERTLGEIKAIARRVLMPEFLAAGAIHIKVLAESNRLAEVARIPDVIAIEPWAEIRPRDERANQIVAGALSFDTVNSIQVARPTSPGYLAFLNNLGFNSDFDFVVDVADTGFDVGSADAAKVHPDFLNAAGQSRVAYLKDYTDDATSRLHRNDSTILPAHDPAGHGTINAAIVGGFNDKSGDAFRDSSGFQYGLGVAPFVRVGISKIFDDETSFASNLTYDRWLLTSYRGGARISSNSWGGCDVDSGFCNLYTDDCVTFDALARDVDPDTPGNQGIVLVFASGNYGDELQQSIDSPGTSKNVITVGASENFRSGGPDGCGVGTLGADNASDIIDFSSGGPTQHGSAKPDLVAPGTHIQGAAPQDKFFATNAPEDLGVCNRFFPANQKLYTWSSGTSHSTPMVAGGAALAYQWLRDSQGTEPSPALVKALLLNSTSYITGKGAGDNLPGAHQGWGLMNLARMFEQTDRIIYDQSPSRTFTQSGGAAFETTGLITDPSKEFRVMLVWTDAPGNAVTNVPYVNQLNLEVVAGGVVYQGNNFSGQYSNPGGGRDFINNVQGVRLPAGATGPFVVRVRPVIIGGDGVPGNGTPLDQDFALVVTNGRETALPVLSVEPAGGLSDGVTVLHADGKSDRSLIPGEAAKVTITLSNLSKTTAANITGAGLSVISKGSANGQSGSSSFPVIEPGQTAANALPFEIQIPADLRCGSIANLELQLDLAGGRLKLPVQLQVGRESGPPVTLLSDNVDGGQVNWKKKKGFTVSSGAATSGSQSYHSVDPGKDEKDTQLSSLQLKKAITIPDNAGSVRLSFFHIFNFEPGYDGGVLEISSDGGETWQDAGPRILVGGYDGKVTKASGNPLGSRFAWTARGRAGVFSQVVINLDDFAGKKINLRFLAGFDNATGIADGYTGWYIDDIQITSRAYQCR